MRTDVQSNTSREETAALLATEIQAKRLQDFLKGRREHLDLSQEDVADRLDISARAYGNWERGRVKEWTDEKLYALAEALEMTEYQATRLFLYAVDRSPQPDLRATSRRTEPKAPDVSAFLGDYTVMLDALSLPTFVIDQRWDVKMANKAYRDLFGNVRAHPTAMPSSNFLRFGLFHPDAPSLFADHLKWQLAMLAQLSSSLERHSQDNELQSIRRDVYRNPALRDAYLIDMPNWILDCGADLVHHEGTVRELRHPDPHVGLQRCRLVEETPRSLKSLGLTRLTLVLIDLAERLMPETAARTTTTRPDPQTAQRAA
ncbi:helix-turn-helix domain-containing protein [Streptomyces sp. NPDC029704]|uniref:MmyB family transcriptional regulator n=1 Tax=Streptomyces sp. NPDC029704 TaxID=3156920 RepID=UPI0033EA120B